MPHDNLAGWDALERTRPWWGKACLRLSGFVACEGTVTGAGTGKDSVEESGVTGTVSEDESDAAGEKTLDQSEAETVDAALEGGLLELEHTPYASYWGPYAPNAHVGW